MSDDVAAIVPIVPTEGELSTETMLRMLLNRDAIMVSSEQAGHGTSPRTGGGYVASGTSAFARAFQEVARSLPVAPASGETLYRAVLPTGLPAADLVPAVGGGFRGMVRAADATTFAGQVRLVPVQAAAVGGAAVAVGPLIAAVGLAVAADMIAQHEQKRRFAAITGSLGALVERAEEQDRATVKTAERQAEKVVGYLLDQATMPNINSASHAFGALDTLATRMSDRLDGWTDVAEAAGRQDRVYVKDLMRDLVGEHDEPVREFEKRVAFLYEVLAVKARVVVLEKIASEAANPDRRLRHVEGVLQRELGRIADQQRRLAAVVDDLSALPLEARRVRIDVGGHSGEVRTSFGRLARGLHARSEQEPMALRTGETSLALRPSGGGVALELPEA